MVSLAHQQDYQIVLPQGNSEDAALLEKKIYGVFGHISRSEGAYVLFLDAVKLGLVRTAIRESAGYASLSYLEKQTRLSYGDILEIAKNNKEFRKSYIRGANGEPVFMKNHPFATIVDGWNAFRYLAAITLSME